MEAYKQRMIDEYNQLKERMDKLGEFLKKLKEMNLLLNYPVRLICCDRNGMR